MRLFLCEKPSQAKQLAPFVGAHQRDQACFKGDGVVVTYAVGHLLQQAMPEDYDANNKRWSLSALPFTPNPWLMQVTDRTAEQFKAVAALLKSCSEVIVATDADREGEVIAREVLDYVKYAGPIRRLWVSDTTDTGMKKALATMKPGQQYESMYASGLGRSRADWLAGINLTRALSTAFARAEGQGPFKFGRVQTPTLALVVRRERAVLTFVPKPYFTISAVFALGVGEHDPNVPMQWVPISELLDDAGHLVDAAKAQSITKAVLSATGTISDVSTSVEREPIPLLYYLGGLQKECSSRFGFSPSKTLTIVQALYETHKATTYPRTDCEYISGEMFADAPEVLRALIGSIPEHAQIIDEAIAAATQEGAQPSRAFNTAKVAASAHHAIIPTAHSTFTIAALTKDEALVFDLIVRRYIGQFLGAYEFQKTVIRVACGGHEFTATGNVPGKHGWKAIVKTSERASGKKATAKKDSDADASDDDGSVTLNELPAVKRGDMARPVSCDVKKTHTQPPKRYTEGSLLTAMESIDKEIEDPRLAAIMRGKEKAGIGTDATRSSILDELFKSELIVRQKKYLAPSDKGDSQVCLMETVAPQMVDLAITAIWEDLLNKVSAGTMRLADFEALIVQFVRHQIELIRAAKLAGITVRGGAGQIIHACPACESPMHSRKGGNGLFWGCTSYPDCKATLPDDNGKPGAYAAVGRSDAKANAQQIGKQCPTCKTGKLTQKALQGRSFAGCTTYPQCKHFTWL